MKIINPVLPGFHPDPSICKAEGEFFIASSTFQWLPGVRFHRSKDLVNWKMAGYALTRKSQLDLIGVEDNAGVWAPCLSYSNGIFFLIFTNVIAWTGAYKDAHNYLVTSNSIEGSWSEPVYINSSGFDPSLFHDDDGRMWFLNMLWDHRMGQNPFGGILLQEYDFEKKQLIGSVKNIFKGTELGLVEGPHLYKKDGWYYLLTAEGGTSWNHAATIARSKNIDGPYEVMPHNPLCTSRYNDTLELQRAGHGSLVETENGQWYLAHLCGRPVMPKRKCILGRETALQALHWPKDSWPSLAHGSNEPAVEVKAPGLSPFPFSSDSKNSYGMDDFTTSTLNPEFNSLRDHVDKSWLSLDARPGFLRITGRESLYSKHHQSLVARRITNLNTGASCSTEFYPETFSQMAGLIFYYDTTNHHYLRITKNSSGERTVGIITCDGGEHREYPDYETVLPKEGEIFLKGVMTGSTLQFYYGTIKEQWIKLGTPLDATVISDENKAEVKFTGAFAGMCVQDLKGTRLFADFDWFLIETV
ncbi:MAG: glycoside hydrolase family 43 protein [Deltaproteobacteria bacterium]|nr:glycoside hydrolase family 43 protein [Deltaproteobacteria bacterium]